MSLTRQSKRAVQQTIRRLERESDGFETVEKTWIRSETQYRQSRTQLERDALGGAGVWLANDAGEVLLVRNEGDEGWAEPGGKVESGESYETAARREVREETGLECALTGLREVHVVENVTAEGDAPSIVEAIVIFDGEYRGGEPRPKDGEIAEVGWFSEPPETALYDEVATRPYPANE